MAKDLEDTLEPGGGEETPASGRRLATLSLTALGVVYGDIGTSPLYALRECFYGEHGIPPVPANVLGVLSLILWSLVLVISVKYLVYVIRADNRGEGGILALMALLLPEEEDAEGRRHFRRSRAAAVTAGVFGAALLYADGTITPAISVLGAVEGLEVATPALAPFVLPAAVGILLGLFLFQRRGTAGVGRVFGPVMVLWFAILAVLGARSIAAHPEALWAADPRHAVRFFAAHGPDGLVVLASVFLVVTGGEALYADVGHIGRRPIRLAWFGLVLPALLLNYFGQGALVLHDPGTAHSPFYRLAPSWALYPLVAVATAATVIASQAVISGAFSLTRQAIQLGYLPRMRIEHTSARHLGQVFLPGVNRALLVATLGVVLFFQGSTHLAGAYGIAVSTTMVITTFLVAGVAVEQWGWKRWVAMTVSGAFLVMDLAFFGANLTKIWTGGWLPLAMAAGIFALMSTWKRGNQLLARRFREARRPLEAFIAELEQDPPQRVEGTAIFLTSSPFGTPTALLHQLKHNRVLHERVVVMTLLTERIPYMAPTVDVKHLGLGIHRVVARHGFMQTPGIDAALEQCRASGLEIDREQVSFLVSREAAVPRERIGMPRWQAALFAFMQHNALRASDYLGLPHDRVIELGVEVEI